MVDIINIGEEVEFRLDNRWEGCGTIVDAVSGDTYTVELTKDCKEFKVGDKIIVDGAEINR